MAYARVTRTINGRGAIEYAQGKDKGHNNKKYRNEYVTGVNMLDGIDPILQMQKYWARAAQKHKIQVIRVIQSFSKNEFNPEDKKDILTVNKLGTEFAKRHYPGRQSMVFTQTDGKSGLVHNHILVNDVHMQTSKGCDKNQYFWKRIGEWTDKITSEYTTLDKGEKNIDKMSQTERAKRELGKYVWKDDLKDRVRKAMDETRYRDEFFENLEKNGVGVKEGNSKKYGEYYTYELKDLSRVPEGTKLPNRALKARSYKLGEAWGPKALDDFVYNHKGYKYRDIELSVTGTIEEQEIEKKEETIEVKEIVEEKELTEEEKQEKEKREKEAKEFSDWCDSIGEPWVTKDKNNKWVFDWDKRDELEKRFKKFKEQEKEESKEPVVEPIKEKTEEFHTIDYSKLIAKNDEEEIEGEKERVEKFQKSLKEERDRDLSFNRKARLEQAQMHGLMMDIKYKQNEGIDFEV